MTGLPVASSDLARRLDAVNGGSVSDGFTAGDGRRQLEARAS